MTVKENLQRIEKLENGQAEILASIEALKALLIAESDKQASKQASKVHKKSALVADDIKQAEEPDHYNTFCEAYTLYGKKCQHKAIGFKDGHRVCGTHKNASVGLWSKKDAEQERERRHKASLAYLEKKDKGLLDWQNGRKSIKFIQAEDFTFDTMANLPKTDKPIRLVVTSGDIAKFVARYGKNVSFYQDGSCKADIGKHTLVFYMESGKASKGARRTAQRLD